MRGESELNETEGNEWWGQDDITDRKVRSVFSTVSSLVL